MGIQRGITTNSRPVNGDHYLLLINEETKKIDRKSLTVKDDKLFEMLPGEHMQPYSKNDFCLIRFVCRSFRDDYTTLSFNKKFNTSRKLILADELDKAEWAKVEMLQEIAACPELTERHQVELQISYSIQLEQLVELKQKISKPLAKTRAPYRGASGGEIFSSAADVAEQEKLGDSSVKLLMDMSNQWSKFGQHLNGDPQGTVSEDSIKRQMKNLRSCDIEAVNPLDIAQAFQLNALRSRQL